MAKSPKVAVKSTDRTAIARLLRTLRNTVSVQRNTIVAMHAHADTQRASVPATTAAPAMRASTKKAQVAAMLLDAPTTVAHIAFTLEITTSAAASLIGDLKRAKYNVVSTKRADSKVVEYSIPA